MKRYGTLTGGAILLGFWLAGTGAVAALPGGFGPWPDETAPISVAWRRVPSPDPRGGVDFGALLQVAEGDLSDVGLAGMMVRCRDRQIETVFVVLEPLPPRTPARVTLAANGTMMSNEASLIPTGAGLLVPIDIVGLMRGPWRDGPALSVTIEAGAAPIKGVVSLGGLDGPLQRFQTECQAPSFGTD